MEFVNVKAEKRALLGTLKALKKKITVLRFKNESIKKMPEDRVTGAVLEIKGKNASDAFSKLFFSHLGVASTVLHSLPCFCRREISGLCPFHTLEMRC